METNRETGNGTSNRLESKQTDDFKAVLTELTEIKQAVSDNWSWYRRKARPYRVWFRVVGVALIVLSVSVPFITTQKGWAHRDEILSVVALAIAVLSWLTSSFAGNAAGKGINRRSSNSATF